jgi:hypothetical protein
MLLFGHRLTTIDISTYHCPVNQNLRPCFSSMRPIGSYLLVDSFGVSLNDSVTALNCMERLRFDAAWEQSFLLSRFNSEALLDEEKDAAIRALMAPRRAQEQADPLDFNNFWRILPRNRALPWWENYLSASKDYECAYQASYNFARYKVPGKSIAWEVIQSDMDKQVIIAESMATLQLCAHAAHLGLFSSPADWDPEHEDCAPIDIAEHTVALVRSFVWRNLEQFSANYHYRFTSPRSSGSDRVLQFDVGNTKYTVNAGTVLVLCDYLSVYFSWYDDRDDHSWNLQELVVAAGALSGLEMLLEKGHIEPKTYVPLLLCETEEDTDDEFDVVYSQ